MSRFEIALAGGVHAPQSSSAKAARNSDEPLQKRDVDMRNTLPRTSTH